MKVLVVGATGGTGRHVVRRLLERGDAVRAFARRPADITERHERLEVVEGDARDAASINRAVQGVDAVISAFGPRSLKKDDLQETLARNLVLAMRARGVKRLVNLSAWGAGDSAGKAGLSSRSSATQSCVTSTPTRSAARRCSSTRASTTSTCGRAASSIPPLAGG